MKEYLVDYIAQDKISTYPSCNFIDAVQWHIYSRAYRGMYSTNFWLN